MARTFDRPRPDSGLTAAQMANRRAALLSDPLDRVVFMEAFAQGRVAAHRGDERAYHWFRKALDEDDSVRVAGLIEGAASVPATGRERVVLW